MVDHQDRHEWVSVSSGTSSPGSPRQKAVKHLLLLLFLVLQSVYVVVLQQTMLSFTVTGIFRESKSILSIGIVCY